MDSASATRTCMLVGIAGSADTYSLSLYNLKAYALGDESIRRSWTIHTIQSPFVSPLFEEKAVPDLVASICAARPDLVGFSCYVWNVSAFHRVAKAVRERLPDVAILWGGPEMTADYLRAGRFDHYEMDYCISGEGEGTFRDLLSNLQCGLPAKPDIAGLAYRDTGAASFSVNVARPAFASLLEVPSPFLAGVVDDEVLARPGLEANIETQRGCSLRCSYCVYHKDMKKITYSLVDRVADEIAFLQAKGIRKLRFDDANFTSDIAFAKAVIRSCIDSGTSMALMFELVPGFIDEEFCALLGEYQARDPGNAVTVGLGVQTINLEVLKRIRRSIRLETFERTFSLLQAHKIFTKIDLIIGLPGENAASIEATMEYMVNRLRRSEQHLLCFHLMRELPGTELCEIAKKFDMRFSSEIEGHELIESADLSRAELLDLLRLTAVIFRLTNHLGWASSEFLSRRRGDDVSVRDAFFRTRDALGVSSLEVVRRIARAMTSHLKARNSRFVQPDFPHAEAWWWNNARYEISNAWLTRTLSEMSRSEDLAAT